MAFAQLSDVEARLEFDLEPAEQTLMESALEDLSIDAREYGRNWADDAAPLSVKRIVLAAAVRYARNFEGYQQSRAGDETVIWNEIRDGSAGSPTFTTEEIKRLGQLARGPRGFGTFQLEAWGTAARPVEIRVHSTNPIERTFPFYAEGDLL